MFVILVNTATLNYAYIIFMLSYKLQQNRYTPTFMFRCVQQCNTNVDIYPQLRRGGAVNIRSTHQWYGPPSSVKEAASQQHCCRYVSQYSSAVS